MVPLSLTLLVLKGVSISLMILAVLLSATLPYYVGSALTMLLYVGKRLNLTDEDLYIVFVSWRLKHFEFFRSNGDFRLKRVQPVSEDHSGFNRNELQQESHDASVLDENDDNDSISSACIAVQAGEQLGEWTYRLSR